MSNDETRNDEQDQRQAPQAPLHPALVGNVHMPQENALLPADDRFDPWHWLAIGIEPDGKGGVTDWQMHEYEPDTGERRVWAQATKHRGTLTKLVLLPAYPDRYPGLQPVVVLVPRGAKAVFARRRDAYEISDPTGPINVLPRIHYAGFRRGKYEYLLALFDDGSCVLTDDRNAL